MALKYLTFNRPIIRVAGELIRKAFAGIPKAQVVRSVVLNQRDRPTDRENRSLRRPWYAALKPTLEKLGLLRPFAGDPHDAAALEAWTKEREKVERS